MICRTQMRAPGLHDPLALLCLALLWVGSLTACTTARPPSKVGKKFETGTASWYGPKFHGRRTANGEVYDMFELTAAHKKLPFGTVVEVRSLDTGKSITVRINDRGPFVRGRIIDLSRAAADAIDMIGPGTAKVELYLVSGALTEVFTVQVAAFKRQAHAEELANKLEKRHGPVRISSGGGWHRVQVGRFSKRAEALDLRRRLQKEGYSGNVKGVALQNP